MILLYGALYLVGGWLLTPERLFWSLWGYSKSAAVNVEAMLLVLASVSAFSALYSFGKKFIFRSEMKSLQALEKQSRPLANFGLFMLSQSLIVTLSSVGLANILELGRTTALKRAFSEHAVEGLTSMATLLLGYILTLGAVLVTCKSRKMKTRFGVLLVLIVFYNLLISERINMFIVLVGLTLIIIRRRKIKFSVIILFLSVALLMGILVFSFLQAACWNYYAQNPSVGEILIFGIEQFSLYGAINIRNLSSLVSSDSAFRGGGMSFIQPLVGIGLLRFYDDYLSVYSSGLIRSGAGTFSAYGEFFLDFGWFSLLLWAAWGFISGAIWMSANVNWFFEPLNALNLAVLAISFQIGPVRTRTVFSLLAILVPMIIMTIVNGNFSQQCSTRRSSL